MDEMNNVTVNELEEGIFDDYSEETTDLAPVEDNKEESNKIGGAEIALGALALVGAGFIVKKTIDGGKWLVGKAKAGIANLKDKSKKNGEGQEEIEEPEEAEETAAEPEKVQGEVVDK